jgi:hypothetical protein
LKQGGQSSGLRGAAAASNGLARDIAEGDNIMSAEPLSRERREARPEKRPFSWSVFESLAKADFEAKASMATASHVSLMVCRGKKAFGYE